MKDGNKATKVSAHIETKILFIIKYRNQFLPKEKITINYITEVIDIMDLK